MTAGPASTTLVAGSTDGAPDPAGGRLALLGIRHHGPGSARSVIRALDALRPATVLVELPADSAPLLPWIADDRLEPPVALLASRVDDPVRAAFWPLADFSPEWSAVRWAIDHGVPVDPIDAPASWVLTTESTGGGVERGDHRDPLAELAAAAGEPDAERWWEDVVEHRGDGLPAFAAVATAMAAVREGSAASAPDTIREAHMRTAIRTALLATGAAGPVAVVCGAWHVPALDVGVATAPTASSDRAVLKQAGLTARGKGKVLITWVPWSDTRLQRSTGYGAGVAHPGWYRHVFRHPGADGVSRFFVDAAGALRRRGLAASPDHLIAASRLADGLAALRSRPRAGLAEVLDAARAVMDGGAGSGVPIVGGVLDELTVGRSIGAVPPEAPQVPLARDVAAAQRAARLEPQDDAQTIELDLRTPNGLRRSHLLHRTNVLDLGWADLDDGRGTRGTFRETWRLQWDPAIALRIVECAPLGTTVVAAATATLVEQAAAATRLADASALVHAALVADLPGAVGACADALGRLSAAAPDLADLIDSLPPLAGALRYGDVRGSDSAALATVVDEIVVRVLAGLDAACRSLDDDAATAMVERMSSLQGALATLDHPARHRELPDVLARIADARAVHGLVRGRATRLLHDGGGWTASEVSQRVGRALTPGTAAADAARFVEGFLAGSGTVLVHDHDLLAVVDEWISSLGHDGFSDTVALLRRTFGAFEPAERRQLGALVSSGARVSASPLGDELDADRVAAAMATVRAMLGLPGGDVGKDEA